MKNFVLKPYFMKKETKRRLFMVTMQCYYYLPWRVTSRMIGWLSSIEIPQKFRPFVYNKYAELFGVNLDEIDCDINLFPSLSDFFARPLKSNARPIAMNANIVSPADGTILYLGPILTSQVKRVKGISYSLRHFLGDTKSHKSKKEFTDQDNDDYVKSLLKNSNNSLYQLTVYLAPGDYHRFHSATEWKIRLRRHFQGKLLSVNPRMFNWFPHLLEINERAVYIGDWREGFMAYVAVGATNVGSIRVYCDNTLRTNTKWKKEDNGQDFHFIPTKIAKGEMFGEFRLGSTIVILFEAPKNICFSAKVGQAIKMGEALTTIPTECDYVNKITINLNRSILYALNLLGFC
ncbi:phosphatidylserine decarboxylase isoform X2 [Cotesia typhae]|uniref:phosphatidylserine decarboxylase isoform X2 n=1 Tax=Cotesia typhae TaxID=2053667 RepID=UPI003D695637